MMRHISVALALFSLLSTACDEQTTSLNQLDASVDATAIPANLLWFDERLGRDLEATLSHPERGSALVIPDTLEGYSGYGGYVVTLHTNRMDVMTAFSGDTFGSRFPDQKLSIDIYTVDGEPNASPAATARRLFAALPNASATERVGCERHTSNEGWIECVQCQSPGPSEASCTLHGFIHGMFGR